jgi:phosphoserine aminotransferase
MLGACTTVVPRPAWLDGVNDAEKKTQASARRRHRVKYAVQADFPRAGWATGPAAQPHRNPCMRVFNFSAGPAVLPESVLQKAAAEMLDWHGSGMSVMEMSHRGKEFTAIATKAEADLRALLAVPSNYRILLLQGGAIAENAAVPMNLLRGRSAADYVNTGEWSKKSIKEAKKYCAVNVAASAEDQQFTYVPAQETWKLSHDAAYVHVCTNETIGGVEYQWTPATGDVPLVADMSSHILSRAVNVAKFGVIYAGAQKNMGTAGLTVVIVRDDLLDRALPITPSVLHWKEQAEADSMLNTPATYAIYIAGLVFEWLLGQGGLAAVEAKNIAKAQLLYEYLDQTTFYTNPVREEDRSRMNIPFRLRDEKLDESFLKGAAEHGMIQLKGHRAVGGMRASIYNAMPIAGVRALVDYMREFERRHG